MTARSLAATAVCALLLSACAGGTDADDPLVVAAAADLRPAFAELGEVFASRGGGTVTFSFGSSGQLTQQIVEGAPIDLFASADRALVDRVLASGRGDPDSTAAYATGRLAIWSLDGTAAVDDLAAIAASAEVLAIANPTHAPYGAAARQALESAGAWEGVQDRLVLGENIADAHRLAATGDADAVVTAQSLAIAAVDGTWAQVDDDLYQPLDQVLVVVTDDPARAARAQDFADLVTGETGREVLGRYGFGPPQEGG